MLIFLRGPFADLVLFFLIPFSVLSPLNEIWAKVGHANIGVVGRSVANLFKRLAGSPTVSPTGDICWIWLVRLKSSQGCRPGERRQLRTSRGSAAASVGGTGTDSPRAIGVHGRRGDKQMPYSESFGE